MGLLDDNLPGGGRGLLNTPAGPLPPPGRPAPLFVPLTEATYGEPTPEDQWNTTPSQLGQAMDGLARHLAAARTRAMAPEAADHGLSERRKLSPLQWALNPITSYPETYFRMQKEANDQIAEGFHQLSLPEIDQPDLPASGSEFDTIAPHPLSNVAKGAANVAFGAVGHVTSPINAAYRSVIGQPIEDLTGIPREYTEFAAQLATPGLGLLRPFGRRPVIPPRMGPSAPFGVSLPARPATQALPTELPNTVGPAAEARPPTAGRTEMTPSGLEAPLFEGVMPELAERYPKAGQFILEFDSKSGKWYLAKQHTSEEAHLEAQRTAIQRDIDAGHFTPYLDPAKRYYVDATNHPPVIDTQNIRAARASTRAKHEALARSPEATLRIEDALQRGRLLHEEHARDMAALGQIEEKFIAEFGPELGRKNFKEFADSMGATTAGNKPRANLMMAHYAEYLRMKGMSMPTAAYDVPFPAGGAYVIPNLKNHQKMLMNGSGLTPATPKGYNFSNEFLGGNGLAIDRRISRLFHPDMDAPPPGAYGHYESALTDLAQKHGMDPRYFRDMVWAGADQDGHALWGHNRVKPWITEINEAIERTHRITGMPRDEIFRRAILRREIPLYGAGGVLLGNKLREEDDSN